MAVKKASILELIDQAAGPQLEPGEQVEVKAFAIQGPSQILIAVLEPGLVGRAIADSLGLHQRVFLVLTDRRLLVFKVSWVGGGATLEYASPRSSFSVARFKPGQLWTALKVKGGDGNTVQFNFQRFWRHEAHALRDGLANTPQEAPAAA
jgi:hypothetical protein